MGNKVRWMEKCLKIRIKKRAGHFHREVIKLIFNVNAVKGFLTVEAVRFFKKSPEISAY